MLNIFRSPHNPIIEPKDIKPSMNNFEVIGVFNAGVARFKDEVILLLRVAEKPTNTHNDIVQTAIYDIEQEKVKIKEFPKNDPDINFSDSRLIITPNQTYLTSISHLRLARSKNGIDFKIRVDFSFHPNQIIGFFQIIDKFSEIIKSVFHDDALILLFLNRIN